MHSIRHLQLIQALDRYRSFSRAAAALGVSQPSLTRSLKSLEDALGVQLFDRNGVVPTMFGRVVIESGLAVMTSFDDMMREIAHLKGLETGDLKVTMGPYPANISGYRAVAQLSARYPKLAVEITVRDWTTVAADVASGAFDLGFADITEASQNPTLVTEPVRSAPLHFFAAVGHPLASKPDFAAHDLLDFPWVGPTVPNSLPKQLTEIEKPFGLVEPERNRFRPRIHVETFSATKEIVLSGRAISACIPFQIRREIARGELVLLPAQLPAVRLNYGFIRKRRTPSPAMLTFMAVVRELEAALCED